MTRNYGLSSNLDPHDAPTTDLGDPLNQGVDLHADDPLPDIPDAGSDSLPISSPDPIDFSTKGIAIAGSVGTSTFNDGDDQTLFERTTDAFAGSSKETPVLVTNPQRIQRRVRIYDHPA